MTAPRQPQGPTQRTWYGEGYQAALADLADELDRGGETAARAWISNNRRKAPSSCA